MRASSNCLQIPKLRVGGAPEERSGRIAREISPQLAGTSGACLFGWSITAIVCRRVDAALVSWQINYTGHETLTFPAWNPGIFSICQRLGFGLG